MAHYATLETPAGGITLDRTRIMGILNVTPDSFSDGGRYAAVDAAVARGLEMAREGADLIDVGGESTRPGSERISEEEESARILPVIEELARQVEVPLSVDTYKAGVAAAAVAAGAAIVNDVTGLRGDPEMARFVGRSRLPVILMHALWPPETMQENPHYVDVVEDVAAFLQERFGYALAHGVPRDRILLDPGIGFGKTLGHNLELLRSLPRLLALGAPVVVGPSRKRFLGELTGRAPAERAFGTAGVAAYCAAAGAHILRVHDVAGIRDAVRVVDAIVWQV